MITSGKGENEQQIPASGGAGLESPDHLFVYFFKRSLKSRSLSEISQYFNVDNKLTFKKILCGPNNTCYNVVLWDLFLSHLTS